MAATNTLPTQQTWQRARLRITRADGERTVERRVRVVLDHGTVRVFQADGQQTADLTVDEGHMRGRTLLFTATTGDQYVVERSGCNCGGG